VLGIDKVKLSQELKKPVAKYAMNGVGTFDRYTMIEQYLDRYGDQVEVVVYDVDAHAFTASGLSQNSYTLFYPYLDSPIVDAYIKESTEDRGEYWLRKVVHLSRYDDTRLNAVIRGLTSNWSNFKFGTVDVERVKLDAAEGRIRKIKFDQDNIKKFRSTIKMVRGRGIKLVLLYIPSVDAYNEVEPEKYEESIVLLEEFASQDEGVFFLNYNPEFAHQHELFFDPIHLNQKGQILVTDRLAQDLGKILLQ